MTLTPDLAVSDAPPPAAAPRDPADAAFRRTMALVPFLALLWAGAAWGLSLVAGPLGLITTVAGPDGPALINLAPLAVVAFGMLLAAAIDGYAFKVPNWVTLALVVSGWYLGLLHDFGVSGVPGAGGIGAALALTAMGFFLLFPLLMIGGMGQGDVKMTMGFGSWVGAYFGLGAGASVLWWSFAAGAIIGGVFGVVIIVLRKRYKVALANTREIGRDLEVLASDGPTAAAKRATTRRPDWVRLPYGVPLCAGFLGYLAFLLFVQK